MEEGIKKINFIDAQHIEFGEIYHYEIKANENKFVELGIEPSIRQNIKGQDIAVYTFAIPNTYTFSALYPPERQLEIDNTSNQKVKEEKYFSWKLLEYALMHAFGYKINDLTFKKNEYGKWLLDECYFSLSHSHGLVAVAISKKTVGVDIELIEKPKNKAIEKVLMDEEIKDFQQAQQQDKTLYLLSTWSKKESAYKYKGKGKFLPSKINTTKCIFHDKIIKQKNKEFILTVCSEFKE